MRQIDFAPLYRSTVGFDRLFDLLDGVSGFDAGATAYPPYNIERLGENEYRITMAVAGFSEDELKIDVKEQTLNVEARRRPRARSASSCTTASPPARSTDASASPTMSRSRAPTSRTACSTSTSCATCPSG